MGQALGWGRGGLGGAWSANEESKRIARPVYEDSHRRAEGPGKITVAEAQLGKPVNWPNEAGKTACAKAGLKPKGLSRVGPPPLVWMSGPFSSILSYWTPEKYLGVSTPYGDSQALQHFVEDSTNFLPMLDISGFRWCVCFWWVLVGCGVCKDFLHVALNRLWLCWLFAGPKMLYSWEIKRSGLQTLEI